MCIRDRDKSALEKYYNECLAYYKEADYTADSWKGYQAAMANAKAVLEDEDATEQYVKGCLLYTSCTTSDAI